MADRREPKATGELPFAGGWPAFSDRFALVGAASFPVCGKGAGFRPCFRPSSCRGVVGWINGAVTDTGTSVFSLMTSFTERYQDILYTLALMGARSDEPSRAGQVANRVSSHRLAKKKRSQTIGTLKYC